MAEKLAANAATKLSHVNVPPAQTWNYLRINDIAFEVPTPVTKGEVLSRLPRLFDAVETGIGTEAASWIVSASGDSRYVEVKAGTHRAEPIVVDVDAAAGTVCDTGVLVREGAEATVVVAAHGTPAEAGTTAALVRIVAERGAHVTLVEVVALGEGSQHLEGIGIDAAEGATVDVRQYALGGDKVAMGICTNLAGRKARLTQDMRYLARGSEQLDVNHVVRQRGRLTKSEIVTSGILADTAHKTMRETIDLIHGAKGAEGREIETVLVAGDDVVNKTLPTILCDEDDVAGNHGASIGSISPEQLAYLADRGVSTADAEALFARAIFDDAVIHAPEAPSRNAALSRAELVLGAEIARDVAEGLGLDEGEEH
jgi:Fe-S cluster assembly scaffold protein SufB